jgi:hypothetical protein
VLRLYALCARRARNASVIAVGQPASQPVAVCTLRNVLGGGGEKRIAIYRSPAGLLLLLILRAEQREEHLAHNE